MERLFADVIIGISHEAVDRPFEYAVPDNLREVIEEGMKVNVPFGAGNKLRSAVVVGLHDVPNYSSDKLKTIDSVDNKGISVNEDAMELALWIKKRYGCTLISAIQTVIPVKAKVKEKNYKTVALCVNTDEAEDCIRKSQSHVYAARRRLLRELTRVNEIPLDIIVEKLGVSESVVKTLEKNGIVVVNSARQYRIPKPARMCEKENIVLSEEQRNAYEHIIDSAGGNNRTTLLHGITGSGKTEVYMEVISKCLEDGRQAIVLIPEIALTYQTLMRFYARFGDKVSILNSKMSAGERFDQYERAQKGEISIIIGPRSALFTPFKKLGVIIIDEEHEPSYKSDRMPRYSAVEVAEYIAEKKDALLVLGSATPSIDDYYRAKNGEIRIAKLTKRNADAKLPAVKVVDMREEMKRGNKSPFSMELRELLTECIVGGHQAMLFLNRRGYAGFVSCRECGYVYKCPHCDVALSEHGGNMMVCHYCGYETPKIKNCPKCGSKYFSGMRAGTQQIQEKLQQLYPQIKILRMDADTTKSKDDYDKILTAFAGKEAEVLIGTQMIVKGHDFSNVTLVGVIAADMSLYASDYRSSERTFQLITQAAGRAGRGKERGNVVIQTYRPDNYAIIHAANQDYEGFYEDETAYRLIADYPPISHMLTIMIFGVDESETESSAEYVANKLKSGSENDDKGNLVNTVIGKSVVFGPAPAVVAKIKDVHRYAIYVKNADKAALFDVMEYITEVTSHMDKRRISVQFDIDPVNSF